MSLIDSQKDGVDRVAEVILNAEQPILCRFYMDGCPHCVAMDEAMKELPGKCGRDCVDIESKQIDEVREKVPELAPSQGGFPQILLLEQGTGKKLKEHDGPRNVEDLVDFVTGGQSGGGKPKSRKHRSRKHKSRKHGKRGGRSRRSKKHGGSRKHKTKKHSSRKHKSRRHGKRGGSALPRLDTWMHQIPGR